MVSSSDGGTENVAPADDRRPLSAAERAEFERLRDEAARRHEWPRTIGAAALVLLAVVLAPLAVVATWADTAISDSDRYVETVAPLATDPAVRTMVINQLTDRVVSNVDVDQVAASLEAVLARNGAPPVVVDHAQALAGALNDALTSAVRRVVEQVVTSDQFPLVWENANRRAHATVVKVLTGEGSGAVQARDNTIVLDLGPVVDEVRARLVDAGLAKAGSIPDVDRQIVLLRTDRLTWAQDALRLLAILGRWLPVAVVVLAALGVWLAPSHRAGLMATGIGLGVTMVVLLVALAVLRRNYLDSVPSDVQTRDGAAAIYDTLVRFLRDSALTWLTIAVIIVLAGYLHGPGRGARALRSGAAHATAAVGQALARAGVRTGGAGRWLAGHSHLTSAVVVGAGVLALALCNRATPWSVAIVLLVVVLVLALLGALAAAGTPRPGPGPGPEPAAGGSGR
ncbi:hypothetical protein [Frankia sp. AgKG'84/4]|uniref:hypothetical protein n=1 Tax=Frankia sp. AgKG'84/4 TaxID=573490 RepID=UPI00200CD473|nr:hypothetical protein [Frankia sp. AgKG'84/4]MCL9794108.1 hypothetical protein [Frankia sp. AgKG'84/4]